jgi:DNA repair protein RadA/Sms
MKIKTIFSCQSCGHQSPKWLGRCPDCSSWNTFTEETSSAQAPSDKGYLLAIGNLCAAVEPVLLKDVENKEDIRLKTDIEELDRVLGGGVVKGAVTLLSGDPGIGKSTISLQICAHLAKGKLKILYVSAEESVPQTRLRAERLGALNCNGLYIVNQTDLCLILEYIKKINPDIVIIDSIQVIFNPVLSSGPGSVSQVRECVQTLARLGKAAQISMFIIGHVTKEGAIAGPRVLEHLVDTVLYFEGERHSSYRILRAIKNRFGSTNEIGVFQMGPCGLEEVKNPSEFFLAERPQGAFGSVVTPVIEGTRPMLLEIQALVARSPFGYPARRAEGFDYNRLNLIIAVLEKKLGLHLENEDIFVNVAGGVKVEDPSCDLAVAAAIVSSFREKALRNDTVVVGEIGLASEIRSVTQIAVRINEAQKLGFKQCIVPLSNLGNRAGLDIELIGVRNVQEALDQVFI